MKIRPCVTVSILVAMLVTRIAAAEPGEDHPLLGRFAPADLTHYDTIAYDAVKLPSAPMDESGEPQVVLEVEGRVTWIGYRVPEEHSMLEIARNYDAAFSDSDFDVVYSCEGQECGNGRQLHGWLVDNTFNRGTTRQGTSPAHWISFTRTNDRTRIYLLRQDQEDLTTHVLLFMTRGWYGDVPVKIGQVVIEGEPMTTGQVEVGVRSAEELQDALTSEGRVIVDGVFFAFDSDALRSESTEALEQMARLLNDDSAMEVLIVGHTDNQGSLEYNTELSERRAQAVRQALMTDYGIDGSQMTALGIGFAAPMASNASDDGRALNRRVELVLR